MYLYSFCSTIEVFFYRHNNNSQDIFTGNIFSRTIPDFVKFTDISRTWKRNLLFSRMRGGTHIQLFYLNFCFRSSFSCFDPNSGGDGDLDLEPIFPLGLLCSAARFRDINVLATSMSESEIIIKNNLK